MTVFLFNTFHIHKFFKMQNRFNLFTIFFIITVTCLAQNTPWQIEATTREADFIPPSIGNGMLGIRPARNCMHMDKIILNGVYDKLTATYATLPGKYEMIQQAIDFASMDIEVDGVLASDIDNQRNWTQQLNLKEACLTTSFNLQDKLEVTHSLYALRHLASTGMVIVQFKALEDVTFTVYDFFKIPESHEGSVALFDTYQVSQREEHYIDIFKVSTKSVEGNQQFGAANTYLFENGKPELKYENNKGLEQQLYFQHQLKKGEQFEVCIIGSACASEYFSDPLNEAERLSIYAKLQGKEKLLQNHREAWNELWESDIIIEGNLRVQQDVRLALFNLYMSAREGLPLAIPPLGLSDIGWRGHIFWDYELWMYPALLLLHPRIAKEGLNYRYHLLDAAKQNASLMGYEGAKFPWQSARSGGEETPPMFLTGPYQHHITGDVAWAFWKYYQLANDKTWLREKGYPVIKAVADFWVSRAVKNANGKYEILNVVCPDEFAENVDNNAFTNGVAIESINIALKAARILEKPAGEKWEEVAENIVIHSFDDGTIKEYKGYDGDSIKQADVNLLSFPLSFIKDKEIIKKNVEYYSPVLTYNGPAMSHSVYAVLSARMGACDKAKEFFDQSYIPHKIGPYGLISEAKVNVKPYFLTGAGGMLQAILFGFAGLEITDDGLVRNNNTCLPKGWKSITLKGIGKENKTFVVE